MKLIGQKHLLNNTTEYPMPGMVVAMTMLLLTPFVSSLLPYGVLLICVYRVIRYDAKVFATDYCMLVPVMQLFCTPGRMSLLIWLCLFAAVWFFIKGRIRANSALVCLILLLNYFIARMQTNINDFVLSFGQIFMLYVLLPRLDVNSVERSSKVFCCSLLISSIYALLFREAPQLVPIRGIEGPAIWGTRIIRFQGLFTDPNYYMSLLIIGGSILCKLKETKRIRSVWFWSMGVALTFFGILTYSKTFFLVFLLLCGIYIVWQFWSRKAFKGMAFALVAVVVGFYVLLAENSPFAVVLARLTNSDDLSDLTTGRSDLLVIYWKNITENMITFFFGRGLGAPLLQGRGAHNLYLEIVYYVGIVGLILILCLYGGVVAELIKRNESARKQSLVAKYFVLVIMAVQYFALQGMFLVITYAGWFMALMSVNLTQKETEKV